MYRQDTFEVEIDVANEEAKRGIFLAEGSTITYDAYINDSGPATATVEVKRSYDELMFEDEDGDEVILNDKETERVAEELFDANEERAQEKAWERRYDDRD